MGRLRIVLLTCGFAYSLLAGAAITAFGGLVRLGGVSFEWALAGQILVAIGQPLVLNAHLNKVGIHPMAKVQAIAFDATATLNRSDFGVKAYVPYVSDEIKLQITTEGEVAK